ncbi:MAG: hypothetical protein IKR81_13200 [Victivallales bacterium]|nr:hypothetical protein [Victivallales bacterium]
MPLSDFDAVFPNLCKHLRQAKAKGRTGQAYLLVGDDIDFLERFALAWAKTAACQNPAPDGTECGKCNCCKHFSTNTYPELFIVRPQSKSRVILAEDMHAFDHTMCISSTPGYLKVGMLVEAERMNDASQNAFLKTLEEPPAGTLLLLLTVNPRMLLPTIKSRCQVVSLMRNAQDYTGLANAGLFKALAMLHRQAGASNGLAAATAISELLAQCERASAEAVKAAKNTTADKETDPRILKQLADEQAARIAAEYVRQRNIIIGAIHAWFLQRMLIAGGADIALLPNPEMYEGIELPTVSADEASQDLQYMEEFSRSIISNVDMKLALDVLCLQISEKITI